MTRNQKLIIGLLGASVLCVLSCLAFTLIGTLAPRSTDNVALMQATSTPFLFPPTWTPSSTAPREVPTLVLSVIPPLALHRNISEKLIAEIDVASLVTGTLIPSPDSQHIAYVTKVGQDQRAVFLDGQKGKTYNRIGQDAIVFSPNSQRLAYAAVSRGQWYVNIDGKEEGPYEGTGALGFSHDSQRVAYIAAVGGRWITVVDGKMGKSYDWINSKIIFTPDNQQIVFTARLGNQMFVVRNGKEGKPFSGIIGGDCLRLSPDGRRLVFPEIVGDHEILIIDGQESKPFDRLMCLSFSPDGQHLAYGIVVGGSSYIVRDEKNGKTYQLVGAGTLAFSPDSQHLVYQARNTDKWFVVLDSKEYRSDNPYEDIGKEPPLFSPDSQHLAYTAMMRNQWFVVLDGKEGKRYDFIPDGSLAFSPDSQRIAYEANLGSQWFVVVDGNEGKPYQDIITLKPGGIRFDSANTLHYLATVANKVYLVQEMIK